MSILKSEILSFVNNVLERAETDIDSELRRALFKISARNLFLAGFDNERTIDCDNITLSFPTDYRSLNYIRVTATNSDLTTGYLTEISYSEYIDALRFNVASYPTQFADFNNTFYFYNTPSEEFTVEISYFKYAFEEK